MGHILLPNNRMNWITVKRDSRLTAYGGVVLQQIYKALYGNATALPVNSILLIFCK